MQLNGREIVDIGIEYGCEVEDSFIIGARFDDTGEELTDDQLDELNQDYDFSEGWFEYQVDRAELYYEGDR